CWKLTEEDEQHFEHLWRRLGLSIDWNQHYQTIGEKAQKVAQAAFLKNLERGEAYQAQAPGLWDITFQTAVAQAELEAREYPGAYHSLAFHGENDDIVIETTRPELLPACVALIAHPDDERYQKYFGSTVRSPLFDVEIPVVAHQAAEMDKGSGIAMCCTFGDLVDVQWWRELSLPMRSVLGKDGRIIRETPQWITSDAGVAMYEEMAGKTVFSARKALVEKLKETGEMIGEEKPTQRMTNFFEKGDKPLEIVTSRQWYIRNGGRSYTEENGKELRANLIDAGNQLLFHPDFMHVRYDNWVNGLNSDWLVSRQRFFGVPIPVWYKVDSEGNTLFDEVITPSIDQLPIDPSVDIPTGYSEEQRNQPGGFTGEVDIMDTWATSSLTPLIAGGWLTDNELFEKVFPMDLRPQGQDIIRTWLFSTMLRSHLEFSEIPWKHASISGWILDPDRKKMSKSKGNVVTPLHLLERHGSDAVRYWAASARLGVDATFDEKQMKIGRRLALKVLNASRFALSMGDTSQALDVDKKKITQPIDLSMIATLKATVDEATKAFEAYDHTKALENIETCFWTFCDDYLELVKNRAYSDEENAMSARVTLNVCIDTFVRLLAPFLPFATEEVWSWYKTGSVHRATWPTTEELAVTNNNHSNALLACASDMLSSLRKVKSENKVSQRTAFNHVTLHVPAAYESLVDDVLDDIKSAAHINKFSFSSSDVEDVTVDAYELETAQ
ncbi:MAG: valine--tRNA ligase, partial [Actinomycetaceae bacterium]|nr:valine--tRNA ligase [Actinomycetaceae bacterium]